MQHSPCVDELGRVEKVAVASQSIPVASEPCSAACLARDFLRSGIVNRRICLMVVSVGLLQPVRAETVLFESGTLGATGISESDVISQAVPGTNVSDVVFIGSRFELHVPAQTTQVGGHFVNAEGGTFFGAIVQLDDEMDLPDSEDLAAADVLGSTQITFPQQSREAFGNLDLLLSPGWYAVVFGSGLFGTTSNGLSVRNGIDIGSPSYISLQPGSAFGWNDFSIQPNHRLVVMGVPVPETSTGSLFLVASVGFLMHPKSWRSLARMHSF